MKSWHEYYRDKNKVEILIKYSIRLASQVENFNIDDHPLHVRQKNQDIHISFHKIVTKALLDDIKEMFNCFVENREISEELLRKSPSKYIVSYIGKTLPRINSEILERKYSEGHVLLRTVSEFDISNVFIVDEGKYYAILWPSPLPRYPLITSPAKKDVVFVRDLINAMTEYFYYNFDESIRKIITSLENYFIYYKLEPKQGFISKYLKLRVKGNKFKKLIKEFVTEDFYGTKERDLAILRQNILYIYKIRNSIVHDKLRLTANNIFLCRKAIYTLLYIYQSKFTAEDGKKDYIFGFHAQFQMITSIVIGLDLDVLEEEEKSNRQHKMIRSGDEFNEVMFAGVKITNEEKATVKNN